jgi:uncharacterized membrane protein
MYQAFHGTKVGNPYSFYRLLSQKNVPVIGTTPSTSPLNLSILIPLLINFGYK